MKKYLSALWRTILDLLGIENKNVVTTVKPYPHP